MCLRWLSRKKFPGGSEAGNWWLPRGIIFNYIENPDKTDGKMLVSSFGCSYETADIEFEYTLPKHSKRGTI